VRVRDSRGRRSRWPGRMPSPSTIARSRSLTRRILTISMILAAARRFLEPGRVSRMERAQTAEILRETRPVR
jgi:hypothetical protein